ncbi:MAG TPA: MaoC family dehydratase [Myxococcales bacterium]|jgi:acyl dehydratase|nr:hypothetical protein [Myxococcales bacterium]MBF94560.1 hypothetical protein [Myxococcales bacterium]HBU47325.1 MaoC family dehydratase [Myxococcales bacterium]|tara:strand:+ start:642 stop:1073 length:432 start_codon:yes stop_codon:yes gene_type:complete
MAKAEAYVGREYGPFTYHVGHEKIREYATATKNDHPWHHDEEAAAQVGGLMAPPMFAVIPTFKPVIACVSDEELEIDLAKLVHGEQEFHFHRPIRAGDTLLTTGVMETVREKGPMYFVKIRTTTVDDANETVVTGLWNLVIRI